MPEGDFWDLDYQIWWDKFTLDILKDGEIRRQSQKSLPNEKLSSAWVENYVTVLLYQKWKTDVALVNDYYHLGLQNKAWLYVFISSIFLQNHSRSNLRCNYYPLVLEKRNTCPVRSYTETNLFSLNYYAPIDKEHTWNKVVEKLVVKVNY